MADVSTDRITENVNYLERKIVISESTEDTDIVFDTNYYVADAFESINFVPTSNNNFSYDLITNYNDGANDIILFDKYIDIDVTTETPTVWITDLIDFFTIDSVKYLFLEPEAGFASDPTNSDVFWFYKLYSGRFVDTELL